MAPDDDDLPGDDPAETPAPKPAAKGGTAAAPAKPAAKPAAPEPDEAPAKHTHSSKLTKLALEMGYSQADLDDNPSAALWEDIERVRSLERAAAPAKPDPAAKPEPAKPPVDEDEEYLGQLAEVDPKLAKLIRKAVAARDDKAVAELKEKVAAFEQAEQQRQARAMTRALDEAFAALDPKFVPLVGEGPIEELADPGEKGWRGAIYHAAGITPGDGKRAVAAKVAAAAEKLAGSKVKDVPADPYQAAAANKPKKPAPPQDPESGRFTRQDFANGTVHRPTGRKAGTVEELSDAETARRVRTEHGVARDRRVTWDDDDDLPE